MTLLSIFMRIKQFILVLEIRKEQLSYDTSASGGKLTMAQNSSNLAFMNIVYQPAISGHMRAQRNVVEKKTKIR